MEALDFLDISKERLVLLDFPGFTLTGDFHRLMEVTFSEVFNESPDITIGNLVVPEVTLTIDNSDAVFLDTQALDGMEFFCKIALEDKRRDVSSVLRRLQKEYGRTLNTGFSACGSMIIASENRALRSCTIDEQNTLQLHTAVGMIKEASGMVVEEDVRYAADGTLISVEGTVWLYHEEVPYCSRHLMRCSAADPRILLFGEPLEITPDTSLQENAFIDLARQHYCVVKSNIYRDGVLVDSYITRTRQQETGHFRNDMLIREVQGGEAIRLHEATYGTYTIREAALCDDDVLSIIAYGELDKLSAINVESFFTDSYITAGSTLEDLYLSFIAYLNKGHRMNLVPAQRKYINLSSSIVSNNWINLDYSDITAARFLREIAFWEGGNARINAEGELQLGWISDDVVLTLSANELERLRLSSYTLTAAEGTSKYDPKVLGVTHQNIIYTDIETDDEANRMYVHGLVMTETIPDMYMNIIRHFGESDLLPFSASVAVGASPYLRAGDRIRLISRNGVVGYAQIQTQDISLTTMMRAELNAPDGTTWKTCPVNLQERRVKRLRIDNMPVIQTIGEQPDISGITVTAELNNGEQFLVGEVYYSVQLQGDWMVPGVMKCIITFAGASAEFDITMIDGAVLTTNDGAWLTTADGSHLITKEATNGSKNI